MTDQPKANPLPANKSRDFTPDEENKLRDLASKQVPNIIIARNHYADAKKNPKMFREGQIELAHRDTFDPMHAAWKEHAGTPEYHEAPPSERWKKQRDFLVDWHKNNPEHYPQVLDAMHGAHSKGELADKAHLQEEHRKLGHAQMGGGTGTMSAAGAAAHFGTKTGDEEAPTVGTTGGADVAFAAQNPEAVKQALAAKRFENVPQEDVEVPENKRKAPIKQHPDLDIPENKQLINDYAAKHTGLLSRGMIDHLKEKNGAANADVDDGRLRDAATNAMYTALAGHNPTRSDVKLDDYVKRQMIDAISNDIKAQHTEQVSASAKRASKVITKDPAQQGKVLTNDPEYKKKVMAEMQAKLDAENAAKKQKTNFEQHLDEEAQKRLANIKAAKLASGGNQ